MAPFLIQRKTRSLGAGRMRGTCHQGMESSGTRSRAVPEETNRCDPRRKRYLGPQMSVGWHGVLPDKSLWDQHPVPTGLTSILRISVTMYFSQKKKRLSRGDSRTSCEGVQSRMGLGCTDGSVSELNKYITK